MPYWDRTRYDPDLQRVRDALTPSSFDTSWTHGTGLDLRSAFDLAHDELADLITRPSGSRAQASARATSVPAASAVPRVDLGRGLS